MLACRTRWTRHSPFAAVLPLHSLIGRLVSLIFIYIIWLISCRTDCHLHHTPPKTKKKRKKKKRNSIETICKKAILFVCFTSNIISVPSHTILPLVREQTQIARLTAPNTGSPSSALPRSPPSPGTAAPNKTRRISKYIINSAPDYF
ncbi:hypothetical protein HDV57DRAFT_98092 [Trichoderma longibrachiatum]